MNTFDERERAFEAKFAHDAEMQFNATARRNHLLGLWAAGILGKSQSESEVYAAELIKTDVAAPGDDDVIAKLSADLGQQADDATIRAQMKTYLTEAKAQILAES